MSDEAIQQIVAGCYQEARREHQRAFSQANWAAAITAAGLAVECARAQTDETVADAQLHALERRSENAQLCSVLTNANAATSWTAAIGALEGVESAAAATRLSSSERALIARALRSARSSLAQQERSRERASQRCDYADQRSGRCIEICETRDRGGNWYDRCLDMCERRYPGCDDSDESGGGEGPVLRTLDVAICDSASTIDSPGPATPSRSNQRRRPNMQRREVSLEEFE